jgi:type III secretion protein Q
MSSLAKTPPLPLPDMPAGSARQTAVKVTAKPKVRPLGAHLRRLDVDSARATRLVHHPRLAAALLSSGPGWRIEPVDELPAGPLMRLSLTRNGPGFELLFSADDSAAVTAGGVRGDDLPNALRQLAAEAIFGDGLAILHVLGLGGLRIADVSTLDRPAPTGACWSALHDASERRGVFAISRLDAGLPELAARRLRRAIAPSAWRARLSLQGAVCVAERPVRAGLLASLAPGDVLLLGDSSVETAAPARVRWGLPSGPCWSAPVQVDERALTLLGDPTMQAYDPAPSDHQIDTDTAPDIDSDVDTDSSEAIDELKLAVRFEIETLPMRLAELETLAAGQVVELVTRLESARVRLVACGQTVGYAELVAVGHQLGARIIRMAGQRAK